MYTPTQQTKEQTSKNKNKRENTQQGPKTRSTTKKKIANYYIQQVKLH